MKALAMFAQEHLILALSVALSLGGLAGLIFANIRRPSISVIDPNDPDIVGDFPNVSLWHARRGDR